MSAMSGKPEGSDEPAHLIPLDQGRLMCTGTAEELLPTVCGAILPLPGCAIWPIMTACTPPISIPPVAEPIPGTNLTARRTQLRQTMRARRRQLDPPQRMAAARGVRRVLDTVPALQAARRIGGYWACQGEVPLNFVLATVQQRGQRYWLPRVKPQHRLEFAQWSSGDTVLANRYGIPEPGPEAGIMPIADLDVLLLPLLAFDASGNRLGTGGGYYDRALSFVLAEPRPAKPVLIGIAYAFQQVEELEAQDWDVPLDMVATEQQLIDCIKQRSSK